MKLISLGTITADSTGAGSVISTIPVEGEVESVYVKTPASPKAGSTVVLSTNGGNNYPPSETILNLASSKTSGWYYPTLPWQDTTGANVTYDGTHPVVDEIAVVDFLKVVVAGANSGDVYQVWVLLNSE